LLARVGYFEGTDPLFLSMLAAEGVETLPVANTMDGHGKNVNQLGKDEVDVVVGYLHKIIPAEELRTASLSHIVGNLLSACEAYKIPAVFIAPSEAHDRARRLLGETRGEVYIVSPEEVEAHVRKYL
jgi:hypothetical protein